jgi:hypothetical protein
MLSVPPLFIWHIILAHPRTPNIHINFGTATFGQSKIFAFGKTYFSSSQKEIRSSSAN